MHLTLVKLGNLMRYAEKSLVMKVKEDCQTDWQTPKKKITLPKKNKFRESRSSDTFSTQKQNKIIHSQRK